MILIAHRGNTTGPQPERENHPDYLHAAIMAGYDVEADVWLIDGVWFLGHDHPSYPIAPAEFCQTHWWCHAKNTEALLGMHRMGVPNAFWHQTDRYTMTRSGFIWVYPGEPAGRGCIVMRVGHRDEWEPKGHAGVCSDYIVQYGDGHENQQS